MSETSITPGDARKSLVDFLLNELVGSSLQVKDVSHSKLVLEAANYLAVIIEIDESKKLITYDLYSPEWKRSITVEELDGLDFMESRAAEELKKLNQETSAEDMLLSIDLMRYWASFNDYTIRENSISEQSKQQEEEETASNKL